ncbi:hypothetical protein [Aquimarina algiphila]|uniref:hypothetical protein n=1 Tax=Aquimarina algiphila TaxID=2047982 RepID=UPI00232F99FC|nr:hypothetical protein [Aquimarina algiphila]
MSYTVSCSPGVGNNYITITGLLQLFSTPNPPQTISFPSFSKKDQRTLSEGEGSIIEFDASFPSSLISIRLNTCASICIVNSQNTKAYVLHAKSGIIRREEFDEALNAMGNQVRPRHLSIVYAHPGPSDNNYKNSIMQLEWWNVPSDNIVEITNVPGVQFGLNNLLQLGY